MRTCSARGRILLVDDDPRVRQLLAECLAQFGHEVHAAESGAKALSLLNAEPYDLLVTDLVMPGMSGLEVTQKARAFHPALPIIMVSGSASPRDRQRLGEQGIAFLSKPVDLRDLEETVRIALGRAGRSILERTV